MLAENLKIYEIVRPLILDGAMGTELARRGVEIPLPLWSADANLNHPETVLEIHKDYAAAGADIITTNTFRTSTYTYRKAGYSRKRAEERARNSLMSAVDLARKAAGESRKVAGSMTAVEDCYSPELFPGKGAVEDTYGEMIEWFMDAGVDLFLFETMGNQEEIQIALDSSEGFVAEKWFSLILKDDNHLLDGKPLAECINIIAQLPVSCLLLNCNKIMTTDSALELFLSIWKGEWGVYPNLGVTDFDNDFFETINKGNFKKSISGYLKQNPNVIGACCGSTPEHIEMIKQLIHPVNQ